MILVEVYITRLAVMFYRILKSFSDEGKYFPFTTFRRLIAHTRLTLFFYNQAAQCSGKLAAAAAAAALCKLAQVRAFPNHHITKD